MKTSKNYIPDSRLAGLDMMNVANQKHHVVGLLEFDVTNVRAKLKSIRRSGINISLNAWIVNCVARTVYLFPLVSSVIVGKRAQISTSSVNISFLVEKNIGDTKVPFPLVIKNAAEKSPSEICLEIENAKLVKQNSDEYVLQSNNSFLERRYSILPKFLRLLVWKILIRKPNFVFNKMGNVAITSVGNVGLVNGWFVHKSIHPVSFGLGSIVKKPIVVGNKILIREMMNVTVLIDHDLIDGATMLRFINHLQKIVCSEIEMENQIINH